MQTFLSPLSYFCPTSTSSVVLLNSLSLPLNLVLLLLLLHLLKPTLAQSVPLFSPVLF